VKAIGAWLRLFEGQDVWAIPEPYGDASVHLQNHRVLRRLMSEMD
jgi:hypothetical protein